MKTIEERIDTIMSEEIGSLDHPSFDLFYEIKAALERIATEQRTIDTEKMIAYIADMPQDATRQDIIDGITKAMEE